MTTRNATLNSQEMQETIAYFANRLAAAEAHKKLAAYHAYEYGCETQAEAEAKYQEYRKNIRLEIHITELPSIARLCPKRETVTVNGWIIRRGDKTAWVKQA